MQKTLGSSYDNFYIIYSAQRLGLYPVLRSVRQKQTGGTSVSIVIHLEPAVRIRQSNVGDYRHAVYSPGNIGKGVAFPAGSKVRNISGKVLEVYERAASVAGFGTALSGHATGKQERQHLKLSKTAKLGKTGPCNVGLPTSQFAANPGCAQDDARRTSPTEAATRAKLFGLRGHSPGNIERSTMPFAADHYSQKLLKRIGSNETSSDETPAASVTHRLVQPPACRFRSNRGASQRWHGFSELAT